MSEPSAGGELGASGMVTVGYTTEGVGRRGNTCPNMEAVNCELQTTIEAARMATASIASINARYSLLSGDEVEKEDGDVSNELASSLSGK